MPRITFPNTAYPSLVVESHSPLAASLTLQNSPILFGCRTGICGTCLVRVQGNLPPPSQAEQEILDLLAPDQPQARLACQIDLTNDITLQKLGSP
ncbi:ferredoxin [Leptolyngbya sp. 'hensonii']|uniref:2Fe-2S iron-sulfur cluster-binding protein n=1 Tax=Leptolyngbya sp. 'hensonii' TaxID=1922337 RepID=UPI0009500F16|nr:2Fe-2S iron-sulfur cluster-binding protein [Leptolyngbya sp. 'hensonii']OLP19400.1 ferredoxin [Leptolyngbya sp. 'hensonii']